VDVRAQMSTANINDLPDDAFAYIEPGGSKDEQGKTVPRSLRHFPIHDEPHVRNALARAPQSPFGDKAMPAIQAAAKKMGIQVSERSADLSARALLTGAMETRVYPARFEVKGKPDGTGGTRYALTGYATVYDSRYPITDKHGEYGERVRPGAGRKTLSESPDVVLRMDHGGIPLARTKNRSLLLTEDSTGLLADAPDLNGSRSDVHDVCTAADDGILDEMSFAFRTTRQKWSDDYTERDIDEYSLHRGDVSVVTFGANPDTKFVASMRAQDWDALDEDEARDLYERLSRRFQTPPPSAMPLGLALALAQAQG
jgi:HK97 family phage prohead protease